MSSSAKTPPSETRERRCAGCGSDLGPYDMAYVMDFTDGPTRRYWLCRGCWPVGWLPSHEWARRRGVEGFVCEGCHETSDRAHGGRCPEPTPRERGRKALGE
jgi:uncharacterized protein with PIN domain